VKFIAGAAVATEGGGAAEGGDRGGRSGAPINFCRVDTRPGLIRTKNQQKPPGGGGESEAGTCASRPRKESESESEREREREGEEPLRGREGGRNWQKKEREN